MKYAGKKIIVTGAGSGIGREIIFLLKNEVCEILAVDFNKELLDQLQRDTKNEKANIHFLLADLIQEEGNQKVLNYCKENFKSIDVFIANAGFAYYQSFTHTADWDKLKNIFQLNVYSPLYTLKKLWEQQQEPFKMVVTASAMGIVPVPGYAVYAATKAALRSFDEGIRYELPDHIHLCVVYPVSTRTSFFNYGDKKAPVPWPSQTALQVAQSIVKGVDKKRIYPSRIFQAMHLVYSLFHPLFKPYQAFYALQFNKWIKSHYESGAASGWK